MSNIHSYNTKTVWTGNEGEGTKSYQSYKRNYELHMAGKPMIPGSADPNYLGDATRHNPEEMLLASLSACHMLWYLHLASMAKIVITKYEDDAVGTLETQKDGSGKFTSVTLRPRITVKAGADLTKADAIHERANKMCFIAQSVNFPVGHEATFIEE